MVSVPLPERAVLKGVPKVGFFQGGERCPEDISLPSVMRAVLEYLGEDLGCKHCRPQGRIWGLNCGYAYFVAVSGLGFALDWVHGWSDEGFALMDFLPGGRTETYGAVFAAAGYGYEFVPASAGEEALRAKIRASIAANRPVISFGVIGPPEAGIITGYEEDGAALLGWSFFQETPPFNQGVEITPEGYFRQRGWFTGEQSLLIVGERGPIPDQATMTLHALRRGVEILRPHHAISTGRLDPEAHAHAPLHHRTATGLAAYDAWAAALREDIRTQDETLLRKHHEIHDFAVGAIAEQRWYLALWLAASYERVHWRMSEPLLRAASCFSAEHALMWQAWDLVGGNGHPQAWQRFADPVTRRELAVVVMASREKAAEGLHWLEDALEKQE